MMVEDSDKSMGLSNDELMKFLKNSTELDVAFNGSTKSCCVGLVDIVNSTATTARLTNGKMCQYYSIFLNSMSKIAKASSATVIKNLGDSLLYYFPRTIDGHDKKSFAEALESGLFMVEAHDIINQILSEQNLPPVDYRVSYDYGIVSIAYPLKSDIEDMFGPTVNMCSKINGAARPNSVVIGGDMHQIVRSLKRYEFDFVGCYMNGLKLDYPVYSVSHARKKRWF